MPGDAQNFGTAYVDIRVKLDEYDRELDLVEHRTTNAIRRIEDAAFESADAIAQVVDSNQELDSSLIETGLNVLGLFKLTRWAIGVTPLLAMVAGGVAAVGSALAAVVSLALGVGVVAVGIRILGGVVDSIRGGIENTADIWKASFDAMSSDVERSERGIHKLSSAIEKIPIIGSHYSDVFDMLTKDAEGAGNAVQSVANRIKNIPLLGIIPRLIDSGLGKLSGIERDIDQATEAAKEFNAQIERSVLLTGQLRNTRISVEQEVQRLQRQSQLEQLEGVDRIRAEENHKFEDMNRHFKLLTEAAHKNHSEQLRQLKERREIGNQFERGEIDREQFESQGGLSKIRYDDLVKEAVRAYKAGIELIEDGQEKSLKNRMAASESRIKKAIEHENKVEAEERLAQAIRMESLRSQLLQTRMKLQDESFDAEAESIRLGYSQKIAQAELDGHNERVSLLRELSDARIELVRKNEREAWEAAADEAEKGARRIADTLRRALDDVQRVQFEMQGDKLGLRLFDIDNDIDGKINQAKQQYQELLEARQKILDSPGGLTSERGIDEYNGVARQIDDIHTLIKTLEELREKRKAIAKEQDAESRARKLSDIESRIRQKQFELAGQNGLAQIERIKHSFEDDIANAIKTGDTALADKLKQLRDLEIQNAGGRGRDEQFKQVSFSRTAFDGIGSAASGRDEVDVPALKTTNTLLADIEESVKEPRQSFVS